MAESSTIARPYSNAVFKLAREKNQLAAWSDILAYFAELLNLQQVKALIHNPNVPREVVLDILFELSAKKKLHEQAKNLIKILAENHRLDVLVDIAAQYELLRAQAENTLDAELISAFEVTDAEKNKVIKGLKKRLGREINLTCRIDPALLCGAIVRAGDMVIDGSMATQIEHLATELGA